jgi:hypothetical protein
MGAPGVRGSGDPTFDAVANEAPPPSLGYRSASLPPPPGASNDLPPGMKSQAEKAMAEKKAKSRKQFGAAAAVFVVVLAIVATVVLQAILDSSGETIEDMQAGECFHGEPPADLDIVECNEPHHGELAAVLGPPEEFGDEFPGDPQLQQAIEPACISAVEDYTGAGGDVLEAEGWAPVTYRPNERMWDDGNRDSYCVLARGEGGEHSIPASGIGAALEEAGGSDATDGDDAEE